MGKKSKKFSVKADLETSQESLGKNKIFFFDMIYSLVIPIIKSVINLSLKNYFERFLFFTSLIS